MGKTGAQVLGIAGVALTIWNPLLIGVGPLVAGMYLSGATIGLALMTGSAIWYSYEQKKALKEAMAAAEAANRAIKANTRSSQVTIPIAYGKTRIGGNIIYQITGNTGDHKPNAYLHTIYGVCEGPIAAFEKMWVDDTLVWEINSGDTNINSGFLKGTGRHYTMFTTIRPKEPWTTINAIDFRLGCNSQAYYTQINSICGGNDTGSGWDIEGNHVSYLDPDFKDPYPMLASAYTRFNMPNDYDPPYQSIPKCSWEIRGKLVRDINDLNTLIWTDNPAHILFDVMTNKQYGWSIPSSKIDLASFQSVGSFCAGSGSGWITLSDSIYFGVNSFSPMLHFSSVESMTPDEGNGGYHWAPAEDSSLMGIGGENTKLAATIYDPTSFTKVPMDVGSYTMLVTCSMFAYNKRGFITYKLYGDTGWNLRFAGYKDLGIEGRTTLHAGATDYMLMDYQTGYYGGDISSGTILGSVDYSTGTVHWHTDSLHGTFSGQEYDSNAWYDLGPLPVDIEANWFYGYGGWGAVPKKDLQWDNFTITGNTSYGTENLTVTSGGILTSDVLVGGRYAGGGLVDLISGLMIFYFLGQPSDPSDVYVDTTFWANLGYSINGIISDSKPAVDVVREICQHFRGYLVYNQGIYQLKVDKTDTPVYAFDEDNIKAGSFVINQTPISERPNRVRVKYTDKTDGYAQKDVTYEPTNPIISLDDYVIEHILSLPYCVYKDQAYRMAQTVGRQAQLGNACQFVTGQDGAYVDIGNLITVTWPPAAWVDKEFRVVEIEEKPDEEFSLSCVEYDASVYADEYTG